MERMNWLRWLFTPPRPIGYGESIKAWSEMSAENAQLRIKLAEVEKALANANNRLAELAKSVKVGRGEAFQERQPDPGGDISFPFTGNPRGYHEGARSWDD